MLKDKRVKKLKNLIRDTFRIRPNHNPIYVDVADHLERLSSEQHQIFFGRRGSGKSCLLVHFKNSEATKLNILPIYVEADEIKRLGYPDVLIRLILSVMEKMPAAKRWWRRMLFKRNEIQKHIDDLRVLLNKADKSTVTQENKKSTGIEGGSEKVQLNRSTTTGKISEFEELKLDTLERYLIDYKSALRDELCSMKQGAVYIIIDDFYLIKRSRQPDVIDYLHRLFRGTDFILKVGTVRHRTKLIRNDEQTIGVELRQDIEDINLDRTLEDLSSTRDYLENMLNKMARKVGLENASDVLFNQHGFEKLVIASGGVPRDFLTIFVEAIDSAIASGNEKHLTPTNVWKASSRLSYRTKLINLREDVTTDATSLERVFRDLMRFCIQERKKTSFLISQEECQENPEMHELILQLMDFKLIHVIEPDTSAASGRKGRFEAYTLDFSLFMEPRKRNIDIIEFWIYDESGRRIGVREAPIYSLERAEEIVRIDDGQDTEEIINAVEEN